MPNLDWAGRPVLASIINRSSFLIGELLLGKLGETVVVHGNAPHDRSRSLVSHLIGNRASSARKRQCSGSQTNLLDRILKAAERELLALYREKAERVGHGETPRRWLH
jgi:hypothetical protein